MSTFADKLKNARLVKSLKQADVAEKLNCAPTSLTNWENGKVQPSLEVLSRLCAIYGISPLDLLSREYDYYDIADIAEKPVTERTYEEQVALNFSFSILDKLKLAEAQRRETAEIKAKSDFLQKTGVMSRFSGMLSGAEINAIRSEYENNGGADSDIIFAFHALTDSNKRAFLSMLSGLLMQSDNVQALCESMEKATAYTLDRLEQMRKTLNK